MRANPGHIMVFPDYKYAQELELDSAHLCMDQLTCIDFVYFLKQDQSSKFHGLNILVYICSARGWTQAMKVDLVSKI